MMAVKGQMVSFKADEEYMRKLDDLCHRLRLDRSKAIRLALDEAIAKYVDSAHKGELTMISRDESNFLYKLFDDFMRQREAQEEKARKVYEAAGLEFEDKEEGELVLPNATDKE